MSKPATSLPFLLVPSARASSGSPWPAFPRRGSPGVHRVAAPAGAPPDLNRWAAVVASAIDGCGAPPLAVAHGFGALALLRAGFLFERRPAGAIFVAPDDPDLHGALGRLPRSALPYPSLLVASRDDPALKVTKAGALATRWGSRFAVVEPADARGVDHVMRAFAGEVARRALRDAA
jgi:predicted alpha/beta hydrolase family esterase